MSSSPVWPTPATARRLLPPVGRDQSRGPQPGAFPEERSSSVAVTPSRPAPPQPAERRSGLRPRRALAQHLLGVWAAQSPGRTLRLTRRLLGVRRRRPRCPRQLLTRQRRRPHHLVCYHSSGAPLLGDSPTAPPRLPQSRNNSAVRFITPTAFGCGSVSGCLLTRTCGTSGRDGVIDAASPEGAAPHHQNRRLFH